MPKTYSIIISDIVSEQLLARTLWAVAASAPEGLIEVIVLHGEPLDVPKRFSSNFNVRQETSWAGQVCAGEVAVFISGSIILTKGCLKTIVEECVPGLDVSPALFNIPADLLLSLDEFGANLQDRHIQQSMKHPNVTSMYDSSGRNRVYAEHCAGDHTAAWKINDEAVALLQEI